MTQPRYIVAAIPAGYVVAIRTASGALVAQCDFPSREAAQRHADHLQRAWDRYLAEQARRASIDGPRWENGLARLRRRIADLPTRTAAA